MFRYIKDLIQPISKKYLSLKEPAHDFTVSFRKNEKSLICQGNVEFGSGSIVRNNTTEYLSSKEPAQNFRKNEKSLVYQGNVEYGSGSIVRNNATEGKSYIKGFTDKLSESTSVLVEKVLSSCADLLPEIANPDHLKNLCDWRTGEQFEKLQNIYENDSQPHPKCEELPRRVVSEVSSNVKKQSSPNDFPKPTQKKLAKHKENELDMRRMLCYMKNQRELRKAKPNLEPSPMDQILSEPTVVSKQIEMKKILDNILKSRESAMEGSEQNKLQKSKTGLINMDNILEYEEKMRGGKTTEFEETMKRLKGERKEHSTSYYQETDCVSRLIEMNRFFESKMRTSMENLSITCEINRNLKEPRLSPKVKDPKCEELPRRVVSEVSSNVKKQSSLNDFPKPTQTKLAKHKENESDMRRMLCYMKNQRELRKAKTNLEPSPMDQILSEPTVVSKQIEMKKILDNILKSRESAMEGSEQNKLQKSKTGLINMDNTLEYEEKMRGGKTTEFEETMKRLNGEPKEHSTSYYQETDCVSRLIEMNRFFESKMRTSMENLSITCEINRNLKEPRLSPKVKTNVNPTEIKNIQGLKLKPDNKEHTTGSTGDEALENVKKDK